LAAPRVSFVVVSATSTHRLAMSSTTRGAHEMLYTYRSIVRLVVFACLAVLVVAPAALAQDKPPAGMSKEQMAMMEAMEKAATPGENHKLLASMVGDWTFVNRMWMDPTAPPTESTGTANYMMIMDGRFLVGHYQGTMMGMEFDGRGVTGYNNTTKQFEGFWIDNFGTMMMFMTGTYDPAAKAFTFLSEMPDPAAPSTRIKVRELIHVESPDKQTMEWHETRGGKETRTMEIVYTRKK
jgi:Protein of unknown function (DUF1579)